MTLHCKDPFSWDQWRGVINFILKLTENPKSNFIRIPNRCDRAPFISSNEEEAQSIGLLKNVSFFNNFWKNSRLLFQDDSISVFCFRKKEEKLQQNGLMRTFEVCKARLIRNPQEHILRCKFISYLAHKGLALSDLMNTIIIRNNIGTPDLWVDHTS
ncbi:unnamed protein product [Moneuplotes crassus]|uniref:Uncharacterized protein n=1 Tax=Euplotes crassus TaxID=5936 RepID=A0AAD1XY07_EUPCR|nr:unnamed protein product [Moneuplotes crassus]